MDTTQSKNSVSQSMSLMDKVLDTFRSKEKELCTFVCDDKVGISNKMIAITTEWLTEVVVKMFGLIAETYILSLDIMHRSFHLLDSKLVSREKLQLIAMSSLLIASYQVEIYHIEVPDLVFVCDGAFNSAEIEEMTLTILKLCPDVSIPNVINYARIMYPDVSNEIMNLVKLLAIKIYAKNIRIRPSLLAICLTCIASFVYYQPLSLCDSVKSIADEYTGKILKKLLTKKDGEYCKLYQSYPDDFIERLETYKSELSIFKGEISKCQEVLVDSLTHGNYNYVKKIENIEFDFQDSDSDDVDEKDNGDVNKLGSGTFGAVTVFTYNDVKYARKRIGKIYHGDTLADHVYSFVKEASSYSCLGSHKNVVELKFVVVSSFSLILELMDGDMNKFYEDEKNLETLSSKNFQKFVTGELLNGLEYIHSKGVTIRDIKPQNILYKGVWNEDLTLNTFEIKYCDFGTAKSLAIPSARYSDVVCTLWYRPPEVIASNNRDLYKVDVWSLACTLFEIFSRAPLFNLDNKKLMLMAISLLFGKMGNDLWDYSKLRHVLSTDKLPEAIDKSVLEKFNQSIDKLHPKVASIIDCALTLDWRQRPNALRLKELFNYEYTRTTQKTKVWTRKV